MSIDYGLKGKRVFVTGGSHGIGLSIVAAFLLQGCDVCVCSRSMQRLSQLASNFKSYGANLNYFQADVLNKEDILTLTNSVDTLWKDGVDILINNVGGGGRWGNEILETTDMQVWEDVYQKNTGVTAQLTSWAIKAMRKKRWGRVVSIASIYGVQGGGRPWFTSAKASQIAIMKSFARTNYLVREGITFNSIAPGSIMIPDTGWDEERKRDPQNFKKKLLTEFPLGRLGTPEEIAEVVLFVCSHQASLLNGACITVDGGESHSF